MKLLLIVVVIVILVDCGAGSSGGCYRFGGSDGYGGDCYCSC